MTEQNDPKKFHTIDGTVIMNKQMPPLRYTIAEILPAGLTLFSGDSKIGKSLLAVNMCVAVSKGEPFLDFPTNKGTVLSQLMDMTLPANMVKKNLTMYHHQLEQMGLSFENKRTGKRRYFIFNLVPESLRKTIQTRDELPKYINDAPTVEGDEDDGDGMTAEPIVGERCHYPKKGPLSVSVSPFNGNSFSTPNHSRKRRLEKGHDLHDHNDNDGNAPLPT